MYVDISTVQGFAVMGCALAAVAGIVADNYTTAIGLQNGLTEGNPVIKWLFKKVGTSFTAFLVGATVCISGAAMTNYGAGPASVFFGIVGVGSGVRALLNYRKLKASKISLK